MAGNSGHRCVDDFFVCMKASVDLGSYRILSSLSSTEVIFDMA